MKIAVCINGHPHRYQSYHKTWVQLINEFNTVDRIKGDNFAVDTFIHSWNFYMVNNTPITLPTDSIDEYIRFMSPKSHIIDDYEVFLLKNDILLEIKKQKKDNEEIVHNKCGGPLYSMFMSGHLKREFEIKNNFEYDICINLNAESFISTNDRNRIIDIIGTPNKKTVYPARTKYIEHFPHDSVTLSFYYSDSQTFDVLTSLYNFIPHFKKYPFSDSVGIDDLFGYFIRIFDIKVHRSNMELVEKKTFL